VSTPLSVRVLGGLHRGLLRGVIWLAMLPLRAAFALLVLLGIVRVTASLLFIGWAAPIVGLRPAGWLVVIWWLHRLTRHKRAALYRHELLRRAERALERQPAAWLRAVERALGRGVFTLAGVSTTPQRTTPPGNRRSALPPASTTARHAGRVVATPQPAAGRPPEQTLAALGRYAAGWVARHLAHANPDSRTARGGRPPR
jgi:hypothetical protein